MHNLIFEAVETVEVQNGGLVTVTLFRCGPEGALQQDARGCFVGTEEECAAYLAEHERKVAHAVAIDFRPHRLEYRSPHKYRVLRCRRRA